MRNCCLGGRSQGDEEAGGGGESISWRAVARQQQQRVMSDRITACGGSLSIRPPTKTQSPVGTIPPLTHTFNQSPENLILLAPARPTLTGQHFGDKLLKPIHSVSVPIVVGTSPP